LGRFAIPPQVTFGGVVLVAVMQGCAQLPAFPVRPVKPQAQVLAFDMNGDQRPDYWQTVDPHGRKVELRFDTTGDGQPDTTVRPAELSADQCLHVILVLDGVPFEIVDDLYRRGYFRLFPPPSRVVSVFPAMTDLALTRAFTDETCAGYEALYYDRSQGRTTAGSQVYLSGANEPWARFMDYRCSMSLDAQAYLNPQGLWRHEMGGILKTISQRRTGTVRAYSVATAGLGTRGGRDAIVQYLLDVDRLCERLTFERRGRIRFTLMADHGHDLVPAHRVRYDDALRKAGYRLTDRLRGPKDVVWAQYGLVSCGVFHTDDPQGVAGALLDVPGTDLVMMPVPEGPAGPAGPAVIVRSRTGTAAIRRTDTGFVYEPQHGDPLKLESILERLRSEGKVGPDGSVADREWLTATADHEYPDPLRRIWVAFHGLVQNPADVLVSFREGYFCGSKLFSLVVDVASTHGSLSRRGAITFALSNHAPLPPLMRIEDLAPFVRPELPSR
jgi:hypothetical protein